MLDGLGCLVVLLGPLFAKETLAGALLCGSLQQRERLEPFKKTGNI
jgi:hypothetical protein